MRKAEPRLFEDRPGVGPETDGRETRLLSRRPERRHDQRLCQDGHGRGCRDVRRHLGRYLSASFISTVLGTRLPGPGCIYLSQTLKFRAPVKAGDTVTARVTIREVDEARKRVVLDTTCIVGDTVVIDGEALLMVSRRAEISKPRGVNGKEIAAAPAPAAE